jgi:two-component system, NtrC family, nitrogen regulation sensor histidine kinase NtrY
LPGHPGDVPFDVVTHSEPLSRKIFVHVRIPGRRTLERQLFIWLIGLALLPALLVLGAASWIGRSSLGWLGTLGPWAEVAESGGAVLDAAEPLARRDTALASAVARHRAELTESLTQAGRWRLLGERLIGALPVVMLLFTLLLVFLALFISRRLAHQLSRPIQNLAAWTDLIAHEQPLPSPTPAEAHEVREVQALRQSLRRAATDLQAGRERALQQERIRAWGEMARRIAHEMKNPLTPLRLAAYRLNTAAQGNPLLAEHVRIIDEETARLEQLAREFSMLGRPAAGPRSAVDLLELLTSLTQTDVPAEINVEVKATPALPLVLADYNALHQALRNVLRNAIEAVAQRSGARIQVRIETAPVNGTAPPASGSISVVIADNGPGLPAGVSERIFEPDYTTKPRGTGLGLAIARQTIEEHGGTISAVSQSSGGARVTIQLPAQPAAPE